MTTKITKTLTHKQMVSKMLKNSIEKSFQYLTRFSPLEKRPAFLKLKLLNAWEHKRPQLQDWKAPWQRVNTHQVLARLESTLRHWAKRLSFI